MKPSAPEEKPVIYVKTLGGFSIKAGDREINDSRNQSKKPWCLLEYLVVFQKKEISPGELIDVIWADDPGVNPSSALKTLMFRSRKLLEPLGISPQKLLVQQRGSYAWTQDYPTVLDIDEFENICSSVLNKELPDEEALALCLKGLELYRGDFLPKSGYESWVIPISTYYHSLYQKLVYRAVKLLLKQENYSRITAICQEAVSIEPFDEEFHYYLVYSLYKDGHTSQAIEKYNHTMDLFYNEFSISPSDHFKELYKTIRSKEQGVNTNLDAIQEALKEEASGGAFYCEYPVFYDLFQLERRAIERTGDSIYLCLLTICGLDGQVPKHLILNKAMEHLNQAIRDSLRCSDVYTRYSISQYLILLPTVTADKGEMVLKRIISRFRRQYNRKDIMVEYKLQPLLPWERRKTRTPDGFYVDSSGARIE
ncbi:MAG: BTAD domain-containing putative transcriptional regulator [Enterocloster sp.]